MNLSDKLLELRKEKNYTQEQVAQLLGVSRQAVSKWENGQGVPDINNLIEIAKLYQVKVDDLISSDNKPKRSRFVLSKSLTSSIPLVLLGFVIGISCIFVYNLGMNQARNDDDIFIDFESRQNIIGYVTAPDFEGGYDIQLSQLEEVDNQFISVDDCRLMVVDEETLRIRFSFKVEENFNFALFTPPNGDIFTFNSLQIDKNDSYVAFDLDRKLFNEAYLITLNCYPTDMESRTNMNFYSLSIEDLNKIRSEIQ